jgi:DNA-binding winged helix-turn-helix (wHTH) protein
MKVFGPYRLDAANQCLWRHGDFGPEDRILLTPKAFAVLVYLVEHAQRLVTHDELLEAVWPGCVLEPQAVKKHILAVRSVLADRPKNPLFIETIPKRGYRFIAPVSERVESVRAAAAVGVVRDLVGRGGALEVLRETWQRALKGERQLVFITGEPGIGKTALVEEFQRQVAAGERSVRIGYGQCIEGHGSKEAYGPMLGALRRLCRGPRADPIVQSLYEEAPTWLAQLPGLLTREHREILQREILGATRERMLREISDALESITAETSLLLIFEDLHWADDSTVDVISTLARHRTHAKLMVLASFRRLNAEPPGNALKSLMPDLRVRRLCREIALTPLSEVEVEEYLCAQSPAGPPPPGLPALVHRHSGGNPLFMVATLEHMAKRGLVSRVGGLWQLRKPLEQIEVEVPDDLRHLIEAQFEQLSLQEQNALELASISGSSFSARLIGPIIDIESQKLEDLCEDLSRRHQIIKWAGTQSFPDGTATERYEFIHVLYRQVLYERQPPGRRARLHRQIGERLISIYAQRMDEFVPELAYHFEQAADWPRAIDYLQQAAMIAARRYAYRQADAMLSGALRLVSHLPDGQRVRTEPQLLASLAALRTAALDTLAVETYETLAERAATYGLIDVQVRALLDLSFLLSFTDSERCLEVAQCALQLSARQDPAMRTRTRTAYAFRRLSVNNWNVHDASEFRAGLAALREQGSLVLESDLLEDCQMRWASSEYREGLRLALEVRAKESLPTANPNLRFECDRAGTLAALNLVFLGEWGEAHSEFAAASAVMQKNSNERRTLWLQVQRALLHLHARDFRGVLAICNSALAILRDPVFRMSPGWPGGYPGQLRPALVLSGLASVDLGDYTKALEDLSTAAADMDQQKVFFDWYWRMPLAAGLTELRLATGDRTSAQGEAKRFLDAALATEERTWQGLAWEANARVALANRDHSRARDCIEQALATVQRFELPLAAWRVYATAADLEEGSGNLVAARLHRDLSRATILRLANSLPKEEPMRKSFLSAPAVVGVLSKDA